jgi:NAD(P)H-dependent FMN reductase
MPESPLNIFAVAGSLHRESVTRTVIHFLAEKLRGDGCVVDVLDLQSEPLLLYNPDSTYDHPAYEPLQRRVVKADVFLLGTPDYHGSISGALKNFLDHFWQEFAGKLIASVVASHEKGLTVTDQIRTVARQCYAWSLPYAVSFIDKTDVKDGKIINEAFEKRLEMMVRDIRVYGQLLAQQRRADLAGSEPGFLARHRK